MGAAREMSQADFDLERFIDMFDEALTSKDERVVNALRSLMMMVILTKPESRDDFRDKGPLRQLFDDINHMNRRMHRMEEELRQTQEYRYAKEEKYKWDNLKNYSMQDIKSTSASFNDHFAMAKIAQKFNGGKI